MSTQPKIYCDTSTLAPNIRDPHSLPELEALKRLRALREAGHCSMFRSHIVQGELERTQNAKQRELLKADFELLDGILHDQKLLGFNTTFDQLGGFVTFPLISDIQDSQMFEEIYQELKHRIPSAPDFQAQRDAEHLTQAVCNGCDVFLTRDYKTIIKPIGQWLERRFPPLRVRSPTQLLADM
jgi:hypothetical protein